MKKNHGDMTGRARMIGYETFRCHEEARMRKAWGPNHAALEQGIESDWCP